MTFTLLCWLAGLLVVLGCILSLNDGTFIYTLDDPYIHLNLAEHIRQGHYGINASEFSAPSSSMIYPFLLAGALWLGWGDYSALILNTLFQGVALGLMASFLWQETIRQYHWGLQAVAGVLLVILSMSVSLPLTGLEHSLHVLLSVLTFLTLIRATRGGHLTWLSILPIAMLPLVRFEGYALAGLACAALFWLGQRARAVAAGLLIVGSSALWGVYMHSMNLPLLPSSVLVKSSTSSLSAGHLLAFLKEVGMTALTNLSFGIGGFLFMAAIFAVVYALKARAATFREIIPLLVVLLAVTAHVLGGIFGGFNRYELYLVGLVFMALATLKPKETVSQAAFLLGMLYAAILFLTPLALTPLSSYNVYIQQHQMHLLATKHFRYPVGINDLGQVSYHNPRYVLDYWGLGSETARNLQKNGQMTPNRMDQLARQHGVKFAMFYRSWFPQGMPENWCHIAQLETIHVSAGEANVQILLTDPALKGEMLSALRAWKKELPPGASLSISENCRAGEW